VRFSASTTNGGRAIRCIGDVFVLRLRIGTVLRDTERGPVVDRPRDDVEPAIRRKERRGPEADGSRTIKRARTSCGRNPHPGLLDPANTAVASSDCTAVLPTGGTCTIVTNRTVLDTDPDVLANTVTVHYNPDGFTNDITDTATAQVTVVRPGGQGCTPGFWKQTQHFDSWVGFAPTDSFEAVFGVDVTLRAPGPGQVTIDDPTLLQALQAAGGGVNALARHAVSALLNASNPDVSSDFTTAEVIALVQDAIASGDLATAQALLAAANEQECPLS
jgi:hypothetical protein